MGAPDETDLSRELGLLSALTIGVGVMICAGIFVLPAPAAEMAGPAAAAAFVLAGGIGAFTALSISELSTAMPRAGGAYYYVNDALGPLFGSVAGWGNWFGLAAAVAFYLIGFGSYAAMLVPIPALEIGAYGLSAPQVAALLTGMFFIGLNYVGTEETGNVQIVIVVVLVTVLGGFTVFGTGHIDPSNLRPFAPAETGGWMSIFPTAGLVFVSYLGFGEIATAAEEIKDPGRNLPIAVIGSLLFAILLYALFMLVLLGTVPYEEVAGFGGVAVLEVAERLLGETGSAVVAFAGLLAMASSANASILASSRINFAMSRDRIVPDSLQMVHPRFKAPYRSVLLTGGLVVVFILIGDIEVLAKAGSVLHLIVYGLVNLALLVYREVSVEGYDPEFKIPLYPYVPVLDAIFSFGLIAFMAPVEVLMSVAFVAFGTVWYVLYARKHTEGRGMLGEHIGG